MAGTMRRYTSARAHNNPIITIPSEGVTADVIDQLVTGIRCLVQVLSTALLGHVIALPRCPYAPLPLAGPASTGCARLHALHSGRARGEREEAPESFRRSRMVRFVREARRSHAPRSTMPPVRPRPARCPKWKTKLSALTFDPIPSRLHCPRLYILESMITKSTSACKVRPVAFSAFLRHDRPGGEKRVTERIRCRPGVIKRGFAELWVLHEGPGPKRRTVG
ncbi:hypothetical protein C2E23DRAFT_801811 [Lenzites betulinus]|nr:hypothetical protein C2E23DRAFT_801811 [Lenzites betulinus]